LARVGQVFGTDEQRVDLTTRRPELAQHVSAVRKHLATAPPRLGGREQPAPQRWEGLAISISPQLTGAPEWPALAGGLDRAAQAGFDVATELATLAATEPLAADHPARDLQRRLIAACPVAMTPAAPRPAPSVARPHAVPAAPHADAPHRPAPPR
jgi:hypothetical protein